MHLQHTSTEQTAQGDRIAVPVQPIQRSDLGAVIREILDELSVPEMHAKRPMRGKSAVPGN